MINRLKRIQKSDSADLPKAAPGRGKASSRRQRTPGVPRILAMLLSVTGLVFAGDGFAQAQAQAVINGIGATATNLTGGADNGVALGVDAHADTTASPGASPVAIGAGANATGAASQVAIGDGATASGENAIAIGGHPYSDVTTATGDYSVAIGASSQATGRGSLAFGGDQDNSSGANASGDYALAFGAKSNASGLSSLAFGANAQALNANDVALGSGSVTAAAVGTSSVNINGVSYDFKGTAPTSTVSIGSDGAERTLTNVAAGRIDANSTDAVNGSQLNATNLALEAQGAKVNTFGSGAAQALGGGAQFNPADGTFSAPTYNVYGQPQSNVGDAFVALQNLAPLQFSTAAAPTVGLGANGQPVSNDVTLVGPMTGAVTLHNVAAGVDLTDAVNVGQLNGAISAAVFNVSPSGAVWATGNPDTYAVPVATGANATAIGSGAVASGQSSTAIGNGAAANADSSVALGANSVANEANTVSVGAAGSERRVTNVAPAVNGTDAVNLNQMNAGLGNLQNQVRDNLKKSYGGTAAAIAISGLHYDDRPGKISAAVATGYYHNQMGLAMGVGGTSEDGRWRVNGGLTLAPTLSSPDFGAVVGMTHTFN